MPEPYYQQDGITIYHGDCRDVLPSLGRVELVVTDPPYKYGWNTDYSRFQRGTADKTRIANDDACLDLGFLFELDAELIVFGANALTFEITKPGSLLIWDKRCLDGFAFLSDGEAAYWNRGCGVYIYSVNAQSFRTKAGLHPTQKPVSLMRWCIGKAKARGSVVDPFMGSGTTLVAAKLDGRQAIGIEIEERYCEMAANRLRQGVLDFGD